MGIKAGVIGLGWSGFELHCKAIKESSAFKLEAGVDPDPVLRQKVEKELGIRTYKNLEELLKKENVECISVSVPPYLHWEIGKKVLEAGRHLVMEKPITLHSWEADELINLARSKGLLLTVYNNRRWYSNFLAIKQVLDKGEIGHPVLIENRITFYGPPGGSDPKAWRNVSRLGGGALYEWGAHLFDQVLFLAGESPLTVYCVVNNNFYPTEAEDYFKAIFTFKSGLIAQIEMNSVSELNLPVWYVVGTRGSIISEMDNIWGKTVVNLKDGNRTHVYYPPQPEPKNYMDVSRLFYNKFADAIKEKAPVPVCPEDARRVVRLIEYCFQSYEKLSVVQCERLS